MKTELTEAKLMTILTAFLKCTKTWMSSPSTCLLDGIGTLKQTKQIFFGISESQKHNKTVSPPFECVSYFTFLHYFNVDLIIYPILFYDNMGIPTPPNDVFLYEGAVNLL